LAVLYKDTPIDESIVLLSGYLVNDGNIDITPQMTERPLSCELPSGCSWLEFKLTGAAEALSATGEIKTPQVLDLQVGLFPRDEAFSFQALALVDVEYAKKKPTALAEALFDGHIALRGWGPLERPRFLNPKRNPRRRSGYARGLHSDRSVLPFLRAITSYWPWSARQNSINCV
jgi:hypothetical protein